MSMQVILKSETKPSSTLIFQDNSDAHSKLAITKLCIIASPDELDSKECEKIRSFVSDHEENNSILKESQNDSFSTHLASKCAEKYCYLVLWLKNYDDDISENKILAIFQILQKPTQERYNDSNFNLLVTSDGKRPSLKVEIERQGMHFGSHCITTAKNLLSEKKYILKHIMCSDGTIDYKVVRCDFAMKTHFELDFLQECLNVIFSLSSEVTSCRSTSSTNCKHDNHTGMFSLSKPGLIIRTKRVKHNAYIVVDSSLESDPSTQHSTENSVKRCIDKVDSESYEDQQLISATPDIPSFASSDGGSSSEEDSPAFFFVVPEDKPILTDFMFVVMAQIKRGELTTHDLTNARRKNALLRPGYLGLRCRHCGGTRRGQYFPTSCKNLQACPSMIAKHLMTCSLCPPSIKNLLKITKSKHKVQVTRNGTTQIGFFHNLWERIRDPSYNGEGEDSRIGVLKIINDFVEQTVPAESKAKERLKAEAGSNDEDKSVEVQSVVSLNKTKTVLDQKNAPKSKSPQKHELLSADNLQSIQSITNQNQRNSYNQQLPLSSSFETQLIFSQVNPVFDTRSLNHTIGMLDEVAYEILNSSNRNSINSTVQWLLSSNHQDELEWDDYGFSTLEEMIDTDEDYREMIDILADLDSVELECENHLR